VVGILGTRAGEPQTPNNRKPSKKEILKVPLTGGLEEGEYHDQTGPSAQQSDAISINRIVSANTERRGIPKEKKEDSTRGWREGRVRGKGAGNGGCEGGGKRQVKEGGVAGKTKNHDDRLDDPLAKAVGLVTQTPHTNRRKGTKRKKFVQT